MAPAGIVQFCTGRAPDVASGTCVDDNARVWLVAMFALAADPENAIARSAGDVALAFLKRAQRPDGAFHNLADVRGVFLDDVGSEDSIGRAVWACGVAAHCATLPEWRAAARAMLDAALPAVERIEANHARAYSVLGMSAALTPEAASLLPAHGEALPAPLRDRVARSLAAVADSLEAQFSACAGPDWPWWCEALTWGNGRLPESMLRAAAATGESRYAEAGLRSFEFLAGVTQANGMFVPIGNEGWFTRGGARARYDQQPIEACAMVDLWLAAHRLTGNAEYLRHARTAFEWYNGLNTERLAVALPETGACHDGLARGRVNRNQGAESTLSYLHAHLALDNLSVS